jgi:hypothetical protein
MQLPGRQRAHSGSSQGPPQAVQLALLTPRSLGLFNLPLEQRWGDVFPALLPLPFSAELVSLAASSSETSSEAVTESRQTFAFGSLPDLY